MKGADIVSNRAERRSQQRVSRGRGYRPPRDLEYNEYVGELWPPVDRGMTEVHVRYGVRDDQYLDWSITVNGRLGDRHQLKQTSGPLERLRLQRVDVSDGAIRRHVFDPDEPSQPPRISRVVELSAEDHDRVNFEYQNQLNQMCAGWQQMYPDVVAKPDRHNTAFIGYMAQDRDVEFRDGESFGWVRNTVVCIDTDFADMVITDRARFYFPNSPSTAGVSMSHGSDELMKFIWISPGRPPSDQDTTDAEFEDGPMQAQGDSTMGMLVESIYAGDWTTKVNELLDGE